MGDFFKAEIKDRFLKYALERSDYFEIKTLYEEFLSPNYSLDFVGKLIREIQEFDPTLLDIMGGNGVEIFMIASTPKTEQFLKAGGFKDMHIKEEEKWDAFLGQLAPHPQMSKEETQLLKRTSPKHKKEKTLLIILISAIGISFVFTLLSLIYNGLLKPEYVPADEFERKLEQVRSQYIQENKRLAAELEETRIIIDSLKRKTLTDLE
ncbi:hypothetical protein [Flagellimonas sp. S3867]|uniref:hypothetical protein n=1 Tax=Flagellimonas sp. S3867 TaxID=2768063 RepID=UPI001681CB19|nr:hypothetical protein [Flagellimonas sp. S3867]